MNALNKYGPLTARVLISLIFVVSGVLKIFFFNNTLQYMQSVNIPFVTFGLVIAIIIEIFGGVSLIFGLKIKWVAWVLIGYTIILTLIFHTNFADQTQMVAFLRNLAIIGGLILISIHGPGPFSLDKKR